MCGWRPGEDMPPPNTDTPAPIRDGRACRRDSRRLAGRAPPSLAPAGCSPVGLAAARGSGALRRMDSQQATWAGGALPPTGGRKLPLPPVEVDEHEVLELTKPVQEA